MPCCHGVMPTGEQLLRAAGLRVTRPRVTVLDVLTQGGHLGVEEISRLVRERRADRAA